MDTSCWYHPLFVDLNYSWDMCCASHMWTSDALSVGNPKCWNEIKGFTYERCCAFWSFSGNERALPCYNEEKLLFGLRDESTLTIVQAHSMQWREHHVHS